MNDTEPQSTTRDATLLGVMLVSTVLGELKLPGLGVGVQNALLPGCAAVLLLLHRDQIRPALLRHRWLLSLLAALLAWTAVSALASSERATSLHMLAKALSYGLPFLAFLVLVSLPERQRAVHLTLLGFLVFLGLGGILESAFPASAPFRLLRTPGSLSILPRIASFQPWPNPFGMAMVAGVGLVGALFARGWLGARAALGCQVLFVVQAAQSGSRNAWATLVVILLTLVVLARGRFRRHAVGLAVFFAAALVLLPVAAWQAGLRDHIPVIEALVPEGARTSKSIAPANLSLELRIRLWRAAVQCVAWRPWLGIGPGVFSTKVAPSVVDRHGLNTHCLPLNLAAEMGLPALALAGLILLVAVRSGQPAAGQLHPAGVALAALLLGQFLDCFLYDPTSVTLLLLLLASRATRPAS